MYALLSDKYNVITISRDITTTSYNRLTKEEIYLIFIQLAKCFKEVDTSKLLSEREWSEQAKNILEMTVSKLKDTDTPTIIVFNEAFFGQDQPLSRENVDEIIEIYTKYASYMPNSYLYINFLYMDENKEEYKGQTEISKNRYSEINSEAFIVDNKDNSQKESYLIKSKDGPEKEAMLLFNQTKIFYNGKEVGFYNKSSYYKESPNLFNGEYYVIGDFTTNYYEEDEDVQQPFDCLTCYDIDVVGKDNMPEGPNFIFSSNTSSSLPAALFEIYGNMNDKKFFICSDAKYNENEEITKDINCEEAKDSEYLFYKLNGVFMYKNTNLCPIKEIQEIKFDYTKSSLSFIKDRFFMNVFSLTTE